MVGAFTTPTLTGRSHEISRHHRVLYRGFYSMTGTQWLVPTLHYFFNAAEYVKKRSRDAAHIASTSFLLGTKPSTTFKE